MVAGRRPAVSTEEKLRAVLDTCRELEVTIFDGDVVRGKSDPLWENAAKLLDGKISAKTLALNFASNIHNLREEFIRAHSEPEIWEDAAEEPLTSPLPATGDVEDEDLDDHLVFEEASDEEFAAPEPISGLKSAEPEKDAEKVYTTAVIYMYIYYIC